MINGIINVYKEKGYTSHDVVAKLRGILKQKKIGHTGTLDPDAIGVLPVCLGNGTKLCDMLTDKSKEYQTTFLLGFTTDTQDVSGTVLSEKEVQVTETEVIEAIMSFAGEYDQVPPMYSALKVNGKKLYELAREGKEVERKARRVYIEHIEILSVELPQVRMKVSCSKGTYIRTLCYDIGEKLGCGATMSELTRTRVGSFVLDEAVTLSEIEELCKAEKVQEKIVPVEDMFVDFPAVTVKKEFRKFLDNGNSLFLKQVEEKGHYQDLEQVRMYNDEHVFCGIYQYRAERNCLAPYKMFLN